MLVSLLLLASTATDTINVGRFDPVDFPNAQMVRRILPQADLNRRMERILAKRQCSVAGQTKERFNFAVPYAVLLDAAGETKKIVVKEMSCAPLETMVGQVVVELSKAGDFRKHHSSGDRWYVGEVSFAQGEEQLARLSDDPDKVICRQAEPKLGSRIVTKRTCRTVAEWRAYYLDRERSIRDLQRAVSGDPEAGVP